jgi:hypothetical protein
VHRVKLFFDLTKVIDEGKQPVALFIDLTRPCRYGMDGWDIV